MAAAPDGGILVAGDFTTVRDQPRRGIAKLDGTGAPDAGFDPGGGPDGYVSRILVQPDGRILVAGGFATLDGIPRRGLARLKAHGAVDLSFDPGWGADGKVQAVVLESSGSLLVGGNFTSFNGTPCHGLARLAPYEIAPDLVLADVRVEPIGSDALEVSFAVRNAGFALAALDDVAVEAVVSVDGTFGNADDVPVGRVMVRGWPTAGLPRGGVVTGVIRSALGIDLSSYPFVLVKVVGGTSLADGNKTNNLARVALDVPPRPRLTDPAMGRQGFHVRLLTVPAKRYGLEYKGAVGDSAWNSLSEILGDGGSQLLTDDDPNSAQRFYRVRVR
jgi:hypothetical protein